MGHGYWPGAANHRPCRRSVRVGRGNESCLTRCIPRLRSEMWTHGTRSRREVGGYGPPAKISHKLHPMCMADCFSKMRRSEIMGNIKSRDTNPEKLVRAEIHRLGFRFTLHSKKLPGTPDIVLPRHRKIILVHGCFWHMHKNCNKSKAPKTNSEFWIAKQARNATRDKMVASKLRKLGWSVLTVWQCELRRPEKLRKRLEKFLTQPSSRKRAMGQ